MSWRMLEHLAGTVKADAILRKRELRNKIAIEAMRVMWSKVDPEMPMDIAIERVAEASYELADAMLKAGEVQP